MIAYQPFRIVSGAAADDLEIRLSARMFGSSYPAGRARLLGINVRGEDRRMPDVPPAGGSGDFNIQMAIARATSTNLITLPTALTTQVFYSDHPVADRAGLLAFDSPFRVVYTAAATGSSLGADQYLFAAAFAARRGFAKRWNPKRAFVLNGLAGEFLVVAFTNSQALFGNGLVLRGTLTWESRFGSG